MRYHSEDDVWQTGRDETTFDLELARGQFDGAGKATTAKSQGG